MNMVIGIDIRCLTDMHRTGVGTYTVEFLNAIFSRDKENQYYLFYNSYKDVSHAISIWKQDNVHYVATKLPNKLLNMLLFFGFLKLDSLVIADYLKNKNLKIKIDIWFSPNLNFTSLTPQVTHIQTIHDLSFEILPECFTWKQRLWHWFLNPKRQCERAHTILTPSQNTKMDITEIYTIRDDKINVWCPWVSSGVVELDFDTVKNKYGLKDTYILFLGTLEPRKNIESAIGAYKKSGLKAMGYEFIVAGALGWKYKPILKAIDNTPGVHYLGYVSYEEKVLLYRHAKLFVYPSLYEGFGLPVLEAMDNGVPVITSNRSSLMEVVGDAAYTVNPYNVAHIAYAMRVVVGDNVLCRRMSEAGKKRVTQYNDHDLFGRLLSIFNI